MTPAQRRTVDFICGAAAGKGYLCETTAPRHQGEGASIRVSSKEHWERIGVSPDGYALTSAVSQTGRAEASRFSRNVRSFILRSRRLPRGPSSLAGLRRKIRGIFCENARGKYDSETETCEVGTRAYKILRPAKKRCPVGSEVQSPSAGIVIARPRLSTGPVICTSGFERGLQSD